MGKEQEPGAAGFEDFGGLGAFVDREVVEDHDVSGLKGGGQLGFDPEVERDAVHGAMDDPRRCEPVAAKPVAQKPTSPPKVSPPPPKIATAKVARLLESIVPARRARMEVILREEMKLWPQPAFEALGLILKEVVDEQLLLHGQ